MEKLCERGKLFSCPSSRTFGYISLRIDNMQSFIVVLVLCSLLANAVGQTADWREPRHDRHLTSIQPVAGAMKEAPSVIGEIDLGRVPPPVTAIEAGAQKGKIWIAIIGGELRGYSADGKLAWKCHPPAINFTSVSATGDFQGDGESEIALQAGRSAAPFGAAMLVSAKDGSVIWRYDVEPMSYAWYLHVLDESNGKKQILVLMQGYPPDAKNGYLRCSITHRMGGNKNGDTVNFFGVHVLSHHA